MKHLLILFCLTLLMSADTSAQTLLQTNANIDQFMRKYVYERPAVAKAVIDEEGTYYLPEKVCDAVITLKNGEAYKGFKARIDLLHQQVLFNYGNEELVCMEPIQRIEMNNCGDKKNTMVFQRGFPTYDNGVDTNFYEVLSEGKLTLLKLYKAKYSDGGPGYGTSTITRRYSISPQLLCICKEQDGKT
jgi:hypothetical protein